MSNLQRVTGSRYAFTIAEMLLALAITAILLAAVAVALNVATMNYQVNEDISKTINNARQGLCRMINQLRTANAVDPNSPDNECSLITAEGADITFRYSSDDSKLYLDTDGDSHVLCDNVTAMTFTKYTYIEDMVTYVSSVQISITVTSEQSQQTLSAAAVIRRNLE